MSRVFTLWPTCLPNMSHCAVKNLTPAQKRSRAEQSKRMCNGDTTKHKKLNTSYVNIKAVFANLGACSPLHRLSSKKIYLLSRHSGEFLKNSTHSLVYLSHRSLRTGHFRQYCDLPTDYQGVLLQYNNFTH